MRISVAKLRAWDKERSAAHEAGHFVIGNWAGVSLHEARIWRRRDVGDVMSIRTWGGQYGFCTSRWKQMSRSGRNMVAVAGAVAEILMSEDCPMIAADPSLFVEEMSPTDIDMAQDDPESDRCAHAAEDVAAMLAGDLRQRWLEVQAALSRSGTTGRGWWPGPFGYLPPWSS